MHNKRKVYLIKRRILYSVYGYTFKQSIHSVIVNLIALLNCTALHHVDSRYHRLSAVQIFVLVSGTKHIYMQYAVHVTIDTVTVTDVLQRPLSTTRVDL